MNRIHLFVPVSYDMIVHEQDDPTLVHEDGALCMGEFSMAELTEFDKRLLNLLQGNLPVCSRPFARLGKMLETTEEHVLERLDTLKADGFLRRIGTFFNSERLGYQGTLIALCVTPNQLPSVAQAINRYTGVTHNYEREGRYNLWFTLMTPSQAMEAKIIREIEALPGVERLMSLKANKKYKINVQFKLN